MKPLAIDLYCGLGGWTEGLLAEGYNVVGFDIERHVYGDHSYPAQLVLQDALTLHGSQFKTAALIVASPPCQEFSYMAMPWTKAKQKIWDYESGVRDVKQLTALFDACFRIQREAIEAAGHHIPLVVENVRGAQRWVGRSRWNFGSFHLWGDVPALMPIARVKLKRPAAGTGNQLVAIRPDQFQFSESDGVKFSQSGAAWFDGTPRDKMLGDKGPAAYGSKSPSRKAASAMIAKIPLVLSRHIARAWKPEADGAGGGCEVDAPTHGLETVRDDGEWDALGHCP